MRALHMGCASTWKVSLDTFRYGIEAHSLHRGFCTTLEMEVDLADTEGSSEGLSRQLVEKFYPGR